MTTKSAHERTELLRKASEHSMLATMEETPTGSPHVAILHYLAAMEYLTEAVDDMFQLKDGRKKVPPGCEKANAITGRPPAFASPLSEVFLETVVKAKLKQYEERVRMLMDVCEAEERETAAEQTATAAKSSSNAVTKESAEAKGSSHPNRGPECAYIYPEDGKREQCQYQPAREQRLKQHQDQQHEQQQQQQDYMPINAEDDSLHGHDTPHTVVAGREKGADTSTSAASKSTKEKSESQSYTPPNDPVVAFDAVTKKTSSTNDENGGESLAHVPTALPTSLENNGKWEEGEGVIPSSSSAAPTYPYPSGEDGEGSGEPMTVVRLGNPSSNEDSSHSVPAPSVPLQEPDAGGRGWDPHYPNVTFGELASSGRKSVNNRDDLTAHPDVFGVSSSPFGATSSPRQAHDTGSGGSALPEEVTPAAFGASSTRNARGSNHVLPISNNTSILDHGHSTTDTDTGNQQTHTSPFYQEEGAGTAGGDGGVPLTAMRRFGGGEDSSNNNKSDAFDAVFNAFLDKAGD